MLDELWLHYTSFLVVQQDVSLLLYKYFALSPWFSKFYVFIPSFCCFVVETVMWMFQEFHGTKQIPYKGHFAETI